MKLKARNSLWVCTTALYMCSPLSAFALPQDGVVVAGDASIATSAQAVDITQRSQKAIIDWRGFDIAPNEAARFHQPSANAVTLNRVNSTSATKIDGMLSANGNILIVNPNGVVFGQNARVDVSGLTATSSDIDNHAFMTNTKLVFDKPGAPDAKISNAGVITARQAGLVGLVAPQVENSGVISARLGKVTLASGDTFTLDFAGDGITQIAVTGAIGKQVVRNSGTIEANGGNILLTAAAARNTIDSLIENTGVLRATAVGTRQGRVVLYAEGSNAVIQNDPVQKGLKAGRSTVINAGVIDVSGRNAGEKGGKVQLLADQVALVAGTAIDAVGHAGGGMVEIGGAKLGEGTTPASLVTIMQAGARIDVSSLMTGDAGSVVLWSDGRTDFSGTIKADAYGTAGNGGFVETSGKAILNAYGTVTATSRRGRKGEWFLDPANIEIVSGVNNNVTSSGAIIWEPNGAGNSRVNVATILNSLNAGTDVTIKTGGDSWAEAGDIIVNAAIISTAFDLTGGALHSGNLTLSAFHTIRVNAAIDLFGGDVILRANNAGAANGSTGTGAIAVNATISTHGGDIIMGGGNGASITAGSGFAVGDDTNTEGVLINANINAGGGAIIINGMGNLTRTANSNLGVGINGKISSAGGSIAITGIGGGTGVSTQNYGVALLWGGNGHVEASGGARVDLIGKGGNLSGPGLADGGSNWNGNFGVVLYDHSKITADGPGSILNIEGTGGGAGLAGGNTGIYALDRSEITITGGATASIVGYGGNTTGSGGHYNSGIQIENATVSASGAATSLRIEGHGGGGANSYYHIGVIVNNAGTVLATDSHIEIVGIGGSGGWGLNHGIHLDTTDAIQAAGTGTISLIGREGLSNINTYGINISRDRTISSGALAGVAIYTDSLVVDVANAINMAGKLTIASYSDLSLGVGASSGYGMNLDDVTLSRIVAGSYQFGTLTTPTGAARTQGVTLSTGLDFGTSDVTVVSNRNLTVGSAFTRTAPGSTGKLVLEAVGDIIVNGAITQRADMLLRANSLGNPDGSGGSGSILINAALASNGGKITLGGGSGAITAGTYDANGNLLTPGQGFAVGNNIVAGGYQQGAVGIVVAAGVDAGGGAIIMNGMGNQARTHNFNYGVAVVGNNKVRSAGGTIDIYGVGGGSGTSAGNYGVGVLSSGAAIEATAGADARIAGKGGNLTGSGNNNHGVRLQDLGKITADGTGSTLLIHGVGGGATSGDMNVGVYIYGGGDAGSNNSEIVATNGASAIVIGKGGNLNGTADVNHGIYIENAGKIRVTGSGSLTVEGRGGGGSNTTYNMGINVKDTYSTISSENGDIILRGYGGNITGAGGLENVGVLVETTHGIQTTGSGSLFLTGVGGSAAWGDSHGIKVTVANGIATRGASGDRAIMLQTDSIMLDVASAINAAGELVLATYSNITLGVGASTGYGLNLNTTLLSRMNAMAWRFGSANNVTVTHDFGNRNVTFVSGGDLLIAASQTKASGAGTVGHTYIANGNITFSSGVTVTASIGGINLVLHADHDTDGTGVITLNGPTAIDTGTGSITFNADAHLTGDTVLDGTGVTLNGDVTLDADGTRSLTIDAGTGMATLQQVGTSAAKLRDLTIIADRMTLGGDLYGAGTAWLQPATASRTMSVAGPGAENIATNLYLSRTAIGRLVNGWDEIQLGRSNGTVHLGGEGGLLTSFSDDLIVHSAGGSALLTGNIAMQDGATFRATGPLDLGAATLFTNGGSVAVDGALYGNNGAITTTNGAVTIGGLYTHDSGAGGSINSSGGTITIGASGESGTPGGVRYWGLDAGAGTINFNGTVNAGYGIIATAGTINLTGDWGSSTALASVSLDAINSIVLPSIRAGSIFVRTVGAAADITINAGKTLTAINSSGDAIILAAKRNFRNLSGSATPLVTAGTARWLVYSTSLIDNTRGGMMPDASYFGIQYGDALPVAASGQDLFLYSSATAPVITFTTNNGSVIYGNSYTSANLSYLYSSGLIGSDALDTIGLSGTAGLTTSYVAGTTNASDTAYANMINGTAGTLSSKLGYGFAFVAGSLKVDKRTVTVGGIGIAGKTYDGSAAATITGTAALNNAVSGDAVSLVTNSANAFFGNANAGVNKLVTVNGYSLSGGDALNYTLVQPTGLTATIGKKTLNVTAHDQTIQYGNPVPATTTVSYDGFIPGEDANRLATRPTGIVVLTTTNPSAGTYANAYMPQGGADNNYSFNYIGGQLKVEGNGTQPLPPIPQPPAPPVIIVPPASPAIPDVNRRIKEIEKELVENVTTFMAGPSLSLFGGRSDVIYINDSYAPDIKTFSLDECIVCQKI